MASDWYDAHAVTNTRYLEQTYAGVLNAMGSIDRVGHALLEQCLEYKGRPWETTVGLALLRRSVTQFAGIRYLSARSSIQPASVLARALFETMLATRTLLFGSKRFISGHTKLAPEGRERRARLYRVEELRREVYRRQAALDGRMGRRFLNARTRKGIKTEIDEKLSFLSRRFPRQQEAFGPFRCFPPPGKKAQYHDAVPWYGFVFRKRKILSIRALALVFGWGQGYEMLYDAFSGFSHVRGLHHDTVVEPGSIAVRIPHAPDDFETVVGTSCQWQMLMLSFFARAYHPASVGGVRTVLTMIRPAIDQLNPRLPLGMT